MTEQNELTNSGLENFDELRDEAGIYIDKTAYLKEIYAQYTKPDGKPTIDKVLLFTRPRRFGKTLTLSMLKNFFELNYQNPEDRSRAERLFRGLAISEDKEFCEKYQGRYPVISISLKEIDGETFNEALMSLFDRIGSLYLSFDFIKEADKLPQSLKSKLSRTIELSKSGELIEFSNPDVKTQIRNLVKTSLSDLTLMLHTVFGQNVILLIDEYDVPLQKAKVHDYYEEMLDVIRGMFGSALKTNPNLEKGIVTGCLRITHESIFTGVNNFSVYGINDEPYRSFIGFTHQEVHELLESQDLEGREGDVLHWYDGYNFAGEHMLCPWSVLKFCANAQASDDPLTFPPGNYFANTSGNDIVELCLKHPDARDSLRVQNLLDGHTETIKSQDYTTYPELDIHTDFETLAGMMLQTGYLTAVKVNPDQSMELKIPNREILDCFKKKAEFIFSKSNPQWYPLTVALKEALLNGNPDKVQELINKLLLNFVSIRDSAHEDFYHGFLLGTLSLTVENASQITSNQESGLGYADLILREDSTAAVLEFKKADSAATPREVQEICQTALTQIEEKQYEHGLTESGYTTILKYGIAFRGKKCLVLREKA